MGTLEQIAEGMTALRRDFEELSNKVTDRMDRETLLSVKEVVDILQVSDDTVRKMIAKKKFPDAFQAGREWRIPKSNILGIKSKQR